MFTSLVTFALSIAAIQAAQICSERITKSSKIITTNSGAQLNFTTFACAGAASVPAVQSAGPVINARELIHKRAAFECTASPCECGQACGSTECFRPPSAISTTDCTNLITEILDTDGTFIIPAGEGAAAALGTCEYAAFNNFANTAAQFCFDDFGEGSLGLLTSCGTNEAQCIGTGNQFFFEQLSH